MSQPLQPIRPRVPEVSLLTSAEPMQGIDQTSDAWKDHIGGVTSREDYCIPVLGWSECGDIDDPEYVKNTEPDIVDPADFLPWTIYAPYQCRGFIPFGELRASVKAALEAKVPYAVARELWTGEHSDSASLMSTAQVVGGGIATSVTRAADALIGNFQDATGGMTATLHVPSVALGELLDASYVTRSGGRLVTPTGNIVVPGPGYPNEPGDWGPADSGGDPLPAGEGEVWMYVTGPVEVAFQRAWEEAFSPATTGGTFGRQNLTLVMAERRAMFRFPICAVFAALAGA